MFGLGVLNATIEFDSHTLVCLLIFGTLELDSSQDKMIYFIPYQKATLALEWKIKGKLKRKGEKE